MIDQVIDWCCLHWCDLFPRAQRRIPPQKWNFCWHISGLWQMAGDWQLRANTKMRVLSLETGLECRKNQ